MGRHRQKAYALLLMLVVLMGLGGVVATEFTQDARTKSEQQRFLHNQRVLKQAKDALLLYAYNYTFNNAGRGPGRMPWMNAPDFFRFSAVSRELNISAV